MPSPRCGLRWACSLAQPMCARCPAGVDLPHRCTGKCKSLAMVRASCTLPRVIARCKIMGIKSLLRWPYTHRRLPSEIAKLASAAAVRIASLRRRQATLERICADALRLGTAVHLRGAATVEFFG